MTAMASIVTKDHPVTLPAAWALTDGTSAAYWPASATLTAAGLVLLLAIVTDVSDEEVVKSPSTTCRRQTAKLGRSTRWVVRVLWSDGCTDLPAAKTAEGAEAPASR
jgi:hypothetical protein